MEDAALTVQLQRSTTLSFMTRQKAGEFGRKTEKGDIIHAHPVWPTHERVHRRGKISRRRSGAGQDCTQDKVAPTASLRSRPVDVDVLGVQGVRLDEVATRLDLLAHQRAEHLVRLQGVVQ